MARLRIRRHSTHGGLHARRSGLGDMDIAGNFDSVYNCKPWNSHWGGFGTEKFATVRRRAGNGLHSIPGIPLSNMQRKPAHRRKSPPRHAQKRQQRPSNSAFPIVGVGASAGGLEAFTQLLKALPLDTGMGFVLVQHLDPEHESALTQILSRATLLAVSEITDDQQIEPNHVYVIPRDTNLSILQGVLKLSPRQDSQVPHRPIDSFFESLAQDQRFRAIGVVLSGTASDGTLGLEAIKSEGGITFAQDDSAKHDSMPRSAIAAGCVDLVLSPAGIAAELARIAKHPYVAGQPLAISMHAAEDPAKAIAHEDNAALLASGGRRVLPGGTKPARTEASAALAGAGQGYDTILRRLHSHSDVDFSLYRSNTIHRRIDRRVILTKHNTLAEYASFLQANAKELDALYSDVLISVTSFFRNPEMFDALKESVFPKLLKLRGETPLRFWVLGCSTGQEAYSIAMAFLETSDKASQSRDLQIFATDINDALLDKARQGLYAKSLAGEIAPERLRRFFSEEQAGYRISKRLREMVVFARQNLLADPPFSHMDLISCRNLLIYLGSDLQKKVLPTFHYALNANGFLLLGASESIGDFTDLFEPVDRKHKIYSRKPAPTRVFHLPVRSAPREQHILRGRQRPPALPQPAEQPASPAGPRSELSAQREADRITVNQFAPPGVLVNAELQIVQFRGPTGAYLQPPTGKASFDLLKMARNGLMLPLRAAVNRARKENRTARKENVRLEENGNTRSVNIEVIPLKNLSERNFLILFEPAEKPARAPVAERPIRRPLTTKQKQRRGADLETELAEMREFLETLQEQQNAANEELQASNEEVQSANEELQSINEELETSKEELESANEELVTVNEEMNHRNVELSRLNNDLVNLEAAAQMSVVLLARDLSIRRFSPSAEKLLHLTTADIGRPIGLLRHGLVCGPGSAQESADSTADLARIATEVIANVRERTCEVQDKNGHWYALRVRPYITLDNKLDGAVLILVDVDVLKRSERIAAAARDYAEKTLATIRQPLLVLDNQLRVENANRAYYESFAVSPGETVGRFIYDLGNRQWDTAELRAQLTRVLRQGATIEGFQIDHHFDTVGRRVLLLNARRVVDAQPQSERVLVAIEDITDRERAAEDLKRHADQFKMLLFTAPFGVYLVGADFRVRHVNPGTLKVFGDITVLGRDFDELMHALWQKPYADEIVQRFRHTLETGESYISAERIEQRLDRGITEAYEWQIHQVALPEGGHGVVCYFQDVSARVTADNALRGMDRQIRKQADQLVEESRRKDEFLAMLSHELRNPLAAIRSAEHLLGIHATDTEKPIQKKAREIIGRQVTNVTSLVNDLLAVSRIISGHVHLDRHVIDLNVVLQRVVDMIAPLFEQRKHALILTLCNGPAWVDGDETRLEEVFVNLLNNAAKYTDEGGQIEVRCEQTAPPESYVQVRVRDNGIGINSDLLPRVFELFSQGDHSLARSAGGLGIGLSLVQRLVELHGGKIDAHSPPRDSPSERGTEFIVRLPASPAPAVPVASVSTADNAAKKSLRVLLVDDNVDQVTMLVNTLQHLGHDVQSAYTGPHGLQIALQWRPDIVLLDIGLPGLDGYQVARRLQSEPDTKSIRLFALSGYATPADIAKAREAGFEAHLAKPLEFAELERLLAQRVN